MQAVTSQIARWALQLSKEMRVLDHINVQVRVDPLPPCSGLLHSSGCGHEAHRDIDGGAGPQHGSGRDVHDGQAGRHDGDLLKHMAELPQAAQQMGDVLTLRAPSQQYWLLAQR